MLTPDTVQVLREAFSQVQVSPDIAPPPVAGPDIPDGVVCENPDCGMDLMGDQMTAYERPTMSLLRRGKNQRCSTCTSTDTGSSAHVPAKKHID